MIKKNLVMAAALFFAGAASAEDITSTEDYMCDDGSELSVAYISTSEGSAFAVLLVDDGMHIASIAVSASGVRYVGTEDDRYSWHEKRGEGILTVPDRNERKCSLQEAATATVNVDDVHAAVAGNAECDVDTAVHDDHVVFTVNGVTEGQEMCNLTVAAGKGQELSLEWLSSSPHGAWIVDPEYTSFTDTSPYAVKQDGDIAVGIRLPRAKAIESTSPEAFSVAITVK